MQSSDEDPLTREIIGRAMHVHSQLGPGLLEGVYETCLAYELDKIGIKTTRQKPLPVLYDGVRRHGIKRVSN